MFSVAQVEDHLAKKWELQLAGVKMFTRHLEFSSSHAHRELMSLSYVKSDDFPQICTSVLYFE